MSANWGELIGQDLPNVGFLLISNNWSTLKALIKMGLLLVIGAQIELTNQIKFSFAIDGVAYRIMWM